MKKKHIYVSEEVHAEVKKRAKLYGRQINMKLIDDLISLGLEQWDKLQKKFNHSINSQVDTINKQEH